MKRIVVTIGAALVSSIVMSQVTITIDKAKQYQRIEGFGGNIEYYTSKSRAQPKVATDEHVDLIVNDLGATIFRNLIDGTFEYVNDNNDPKVSDMSKFYKKNPGGLTGCQGNVHYDMDVAATMFKKFKQKIASNGDTARLYTTVFSPQSWTKYTNCIFGEDFAWNRMATFEEETAKGGTDGVNGVKDFKDEFAEFCYVYMKIMKDLGVDVDAFSIQNEPAFPEFYSSCVYSAESYGAVFKTVGKRFLNENIKTRMIFTEDIGDLGRYNSFVQVITRDVESTKFADIAAVHSYAADGISSGSTDAKLWESLDKVSRQRIAPGLKRSFWQTETSGYQDHLDIAIAIYTGLRYGKLNAWMHHQIFTDGGIFQEFDNTRNFQYYGCKHFFKYVRQGSIMVNATPSDESLLATAFQNDKDKKLTLVLINYDKTKSNKFKLSSVQSTGIPATFKMYLTTKETPTTAGALNLCAEKGSIRFGEVIDIPAGAVVTLVGENSLPELPTSNEEEQLSNLKFEVYPNPSQEGFYFVSRTGANANLSIEIMDMQGRLVMSLPYHQVGKEQYIESSGLTNGVYTVKYNNQFQKVVINK